MNVVTFTIKGISSYSQSKKISSPKNGKETHQDHEERCWRDRLHVEDKQVFIPPMAIKNALSETAKFLSMQVPGKGKATYTKFFETGILCFEPIMIHGADGKPVMESKVEGEWLFVPASGIRGDSKRVDKCFPVIKSGWTGTVTITVMHEMITQEVLKTHLECMGRFIGIGRFRPRNNGYYGRFNVSNIKWSPLSEAA